MAQSQDSYSSAVERYGGVRKMVETIRTKECLLPSHMTQYQTVQQQNDASQRVMNQTMNAKEEHLQRHVNDNATCKPFGRAAIL